MKKSNLIYTCTAAMLLATSMVAQVAQVAVPMDSVKKDTKAVSPLSTDGFKINFNESGSRYAKINFTTQMWAMQNANNPGSQVNGVGQANSYLIGLRRTRLTIASQITEKVFIFGQIGSDGISPLSGGRNVPLQFLDMTAEYKLIGKYLTLGGGLTGWDGLSRYANPSVPSVLGLDMPLYQQATVNITDNTVRMPGIFAKGKLGKLDYRMAINIPYPTTVNNPLTNTITVAASTINPQFNASTFATNKIAPHMQGYFMYQFLDQESNTNPGTVGSYLGTKTVFNIGAGFRYQQNAMWHGDYNQGSTPSTTANPGGTPILTIKDTARTAMMLWSVDVFYDAPINKDKGTAITFYAAYSNYNFGKNYVRNSNPLNPATGVTNNVPGGNFNSNLSSFNGSGNQFPMLGTGSIYYAQLGYLMPKFKNNTQLQPYGQFMYANYEAFKDPVELWDLGFNYIIKGNNSKISLDYQSRPVFNLSTSDYQIHNVKSARRGMVVLQYQISF